MLEIETGLRLRAARLSAGLTVARVSQLAGASVSTIKRWEAGKGLPSTPDLEQYLVQIGAPSPCDLHLDREELGGKVSQRLLRAKRRRSMLTLEEVSALTGISVASLHRYETGARAPSPAAMAQIAMAYGCSGAEANLLCAQSEESGGSVVDKFLTPSSQPHFWLFHRLESKLRPGTRITAEDVLDLIQGFMIMGDHRSLLEAWELLRPAVQRLTLSQDRASTILLSLALARHTVTGNKRTTNERLSRVRVEGGELNSHGLSHMYRISAVLGELDEAEAWLNRLAYFAAKSGDEGLLFVSELSRVMLAFDRTRSHKLLSSLDLIRAHSLIPLHQYTLDVAELHILHRLGEPGAADDVLARCEKNEQIYGFGSPACSSFRRWTSE